MARFKMVIHLLENSRQKVNTGLRILVKAAASTILREIEVKCKETAETKTRSSRRLPAHDGSTRRAHATDGSRGAIPREAIVDRKKERVLRIMGAHERRDLQAREDGDRRQFTAAERRERLALKADMRTDKDRL
ncbi:hypothetical protein DIPPA_00139 [Diplonema papillatum]|nr:hypothetical protein DIPPA_00139 [Diplonema papillatum]